MAKEKTETKEDKQPKEKKNEPYRFSAQQLFDQAAKRKIIPCSLSLDIGLSGGIPLGSTVLISGRPKCGKTTACLQFAANAQRLFNTKIFFFPIEGRLTKLVLSQVQGLMLDIDHFEVVLPPVIKDKDGNVLGHEKWPAEKWWDVIGECIENNHGAIIIVDSIANMSSEREQSESAGFQDRGGKNKLESEFCRKYGNLVVANEITLFLIAQIISNTSGYGPPLQAKVGNSIRHQADVILFGKGIEKWPEQNGRVLGHNINFVVEASALGSPFIEISLPLRYGFAIDNIRDIINHALTWQLIRPTQAKSSWYVLPFKEVDNKIVECELEDENSIKQQGEEKLRNWFLVHPDQLKIIEDKIRKMIFG